MFGYYTIEIQGQRCYCNVSLCECHTFEYDGNTYVFDVQKMTAHTIPAKLGGLIDRLRANPGLLLPEAVMETLQALGLVPDDAAEAPATPAPAQPDAASGDPEFSVTNIALFLAQECNMRCVYCYGDAGTFGGEGLMDEATALRAVDWLVAHSGKAPRISIGFFGGEPLLNLPLMRVVVAYAKQQAAKAGKTIGFSITTNASLLTDANIAFLREERIDPLISFDGPPEIQNRQRPFKDGRGSHDTVTANIAKLQQSCPHLTARATLCDGVDPLQIKKELQRLGFASYLITRVSPPIGQGPGQDAPGKTLAEDLPAPMLAFNRQEAEELLVAIRERALKKGSLPMVLGSMDVLLTGVKQHHGCGIGKTMAGVTVSGDVYPCHRFAGLTEKRQGNISAYDPREPNDYHLAFVDNLPECRGCWARYHCGGGCFYHNMALTGDMRRPDPAACRERRASFESLIHVFCQLSEEERAYARELLRVPTEEAQQA